MQDSIVSQSHADGASVCPVCSHSPLNHRRGRCLIPNCPCRWNPPRPESPDALYDLDTQLAHVMGQRAIALIRDGRDAASIARLAASYAFRAYPALRLEVTQ